MPSAFLEPSTGARSSRDGSCRVFGDRHTRHELGRARHLRQTLECGGDAVQRPCIHRLAGDRVTHRWLTQAGLLRQRALINPADGELETEHIAAKVKPRNCHRFRFTDLAPGVNNQYSRGMGTKSDTTPREYHREQFGRRLREQRESRGMSRDGLAKQLGVNRQTARRLEAGNGPVDLYIVAEAARVLDCSVAYLIASILPEQPATDLDGRLRRDAVEEEAWAQAEAIEREVRELSPKLAALSARLNAVASAEYVIRRRPPRSTLTLKISDDPPPPGA